MLRKKVSLCNNDKEHLHKEYCTDSNYFNFAVTGYLGYECIPSHTKTTLDANY